MSTQLYFIYDSHCPWSYAATQLVSKVRDSFPQISIQLLHSAYFDGDNSVSLNTIKAVKELSSVCFGEQYIADIESNKDSTLCANLMTWVQNKSANSAFDLLTNIQQQHFIHGKACMDKEDVMDIISELKLSPPAKCLKHEKLTKDAEFVVHDIAEIQDVIGTSAIPALLLAQGDNLTLLNHNLYLENPDLFVDAITKELTE
jgi:protein-disulfide isomerase-like protein with CxxC motif